MKVKVSNVNTPNWKEVTVKSRVPVELEKLSKKLPFAQAVLAINIV